MGNESSRRRLLAWRSGFLPLRIPGSPGDPTACQSHKTQRSGFWQASGNPEGKPLTHRQLTLQPRLCLENSLGTQFLVSRARPEGTPRVTDMSWGTRCGTGLPARNSPMVGTSVPVPGILSHDISFHTHLPGLSIVLGFNLQHRMGRWSQEGSVRHVGGSLARTSSPLGSQIFARAREEIESQDHHHKSLGRFPTAGHYVTSGSHHRPPTDRFVVSGPEGSGRG